MLPQIFIGIDPSYTKTGVTYINTLTKEIQFKAVSPQGNNKTYGDALLRAEYIIEEILETLPQDIIPMIILEEPLVTSQMSSRLGILSGVIGTTLINYLRQTESQDTLYTVNPNVVATTNRKLKGYTSKTRKNVSREITHKYLEAFESHGYTTTVLNNKFNKDGSMKQRVMSTDEAESFIMALILMRHLKQLPKELEQEIIKLNRGLNADITINHININKGDTHVK